MTAITRRGALVGATAAVAVVGVPTASAAVAIPGPNDRRLLDLERVLVPYRAWYDDRMRPILPEADEMLRFEPISDLDDAIAKTPADSVIGLAVKVRQFRYHLHNETLEDALPYHHNWHLQAVVRDLERLAGEARS